MTSEFEYLCANAAGDIFVLIRTWPRTFRMYVGTSGKAVRAAAVSDVYEPGDGTTWIVTAEGTFSALSLSPRFGPPPFVARDTFVQLNIGEYLGGLSVPSDTAEAKHLFDTVRDRLASVDHSPLQNES